MQIFHLFNIIFCLFRKLWVLILNLNYLTPKKDVRFLKNRETAVIIEKQDYAREKEGCVAGKMLSVKKHKNKSLNKLVYSKLSFIFSV